MAAFELAVALGVAGVAAFPCWRYSTGWGFLPSASAGILLMIVIVAVSSEKAPAHAARYAAKAPTLYATAD